MRAAAAAQSGCLGSNGAGKTTTIRLLLGMPWPTSGQAPMPEAPLTSWSPTRSGAASCSWRSSPPSRWAPSCLLRGPESPWSCSAPWPR
ncbi:ATP-binding cassette domain-containing protein [Cryobacterium sp. TMT2-4]|nr:ATP-binding cassette domain-containing protein [Cryobacterium sp. TMT2-4]